MKLNDEPKKPLAPVAAMDAAPAVVVQACSALLLLLQSGIVVESTFTASTIVVCVMAVISAESRAWRVASSSELTWSYGPPT